MHYRISGKPRFARRVPLFSELHTIMNAGQFIFLTIGFALFMASLNFARKCKLIPTLFYGVLAWAVFVVPKWMVRAVPDPGDIRWLMAVGALVIIGGTLLVLILSIRRRRSL